VYSSNWMCSSEFHTAILFNVSKMVQLSTEQREGGLLQCVGGRRTAAFRIFFPVIWDTSGCVSCPSPHYMDERCASAEWQLHSNEAMNDFAPFVD
jgi:hypothetical protein